MRSDAVDAMQHVDVMPHPIYGGIHASHRKDHRKQQATSGRSAGCSVQRLLRLLPRINQPTSPGRPRISRSSFHQMHGCSRNRRPHNTHTDDRTQAAMEEEEAAAAAASAAGSSSGAAADAGGGSNRKVRGWSRCVRIHTQIWYVHHMRVSHQGSVPPQILTKFSAPTLHRSLPPYSSQPPSLATCWRKPCLSFWTVGIWAWTPARAWPGSAAGATPRRGKPARNSAESSIHLSD